MNNIINTPMNIEATTTNLVVIEANQNPLIILEDKNTLITTEPQTTLIEVLDDKPQVIVNLGVQGVKGLSAYQIALLNGFVGTELNWLDSLKGLNGVNGVGQAGASAYAIAVNNGFIGTQLEWLASLKGKDGARGLTGLKGQDGISAYEVAVLNGFVGSESSWLESLKGKDGKDATPIKGDPGDKGDKGDPGEVDPDFLSHIDGILEALNQDLEWLDGLLEQVNSDLELNKQKLAQLDIDLDVLNNETLVRVNQELEQARADLETNRLALLELQDTLVQVNLDLVWLNEREAVRNQELSVLNIDLADLAITLITANEDIAALNTDIQNITNVASDLDQVLQDLIVSTNTQISNLRDETDTAIQQLSDNTSNSLITVNTAITDLDDKIDQYQSDFENEVFIIRSDVDDRLSQVQNDLNNTRDSVKVEINKNMLDRKESDKLLFETTALAVQLRQNQADITNAIFEVDPSTGTIRNLAYAYTDNQFTQAGLLIDGVNAEVQLQAQRVTTAEDRITNAESELLLQAGQIGLRATYTELNHAIAGAIDAVLPAYSFGFFNSNEGWVAVNGTLTPAASKINLAWGDIENTSLSYVADENPLISVSIERTGGTGWSGNVIVTFDDNSTQTYTGVIEDIPTGSVFVRNLNLDGESTYTGNVTGIRLVLGASVDDTFTVNSITIGKPSAALTELEGITAQINQVGIDLNAIEASLTSYVTVDRYTAEGVTRSNVESVLNGVESYANIQATLQEFDNQDTLTKANYAALWVDAANANIEQTVQSYNARPGGIDDQLDVITGDLVVASSLIDAANGRISDQIVSISGIQSDSKDLAKIALQAEYQLYLSKKNQLEQGVAIAIAKNELNTISNEQLALAEEILLLEAKFGTDVGQVNATLFELNQAIADETEARVQAVQSLEADFNQTVNASVDVIFEAISNSEQALSQQIVNLQNSFGEEINTNVTLLLQAISDETQSRITQLTDLETQFGQEIQATRTELTTLVSDETQARIQDRLELEVEFAGNYATKFEVTDAVATEAQSRLDQIQQLEVDFGGDVNAARQEAVSLIADESQARIQEISNLSANIGTTYATKTEVTDVVATETQSRVQAISTVLSNVENNYATISSVETVQTDVDSSKAISQKALVSISGVQKKSDATALEQLIEGYRIYLAEKGQLELGVSIARAETGLQTETNERLALAQEVTVLEAKLGTVEGTFSAEVSRLDRAITDQDGAIASSILEATTVLEGGTRIPVSTIAIDARSLAGGNQEALATIKTELVGVDGSYNEAALILKTAVDDAGEAVSRAFLGTSVLQPGDEKYTITGLTVDSQTRGIRFQGDLFELVNGAGLRKLYWNDNENEWQIDGSVLLTGSIRGNALVANTITGDKIAANAISADKIVANSIGTDKIVANAITGDKISANAIDATKIIAGSITGDRIQANTIKGDRLSANTITNDKLISNSITADKLVALSITGNEIAANAISSDKIIANSIGAREIVAKSIDASKIVSETITGDLIAANTIGAGKIVAKSIGAEEIAANTITGDLIEANALNGKVITGSTVQTAFSGTRVVLGNNTLPLWYGSGVVNKSNGLFYVDDLGNIVTGGKFRVNIGDEDLFYYDQGTRTLTLKGRLIIGGYTVSSEEDIRGLDGNIVTYIYLPQVAKPSRPSGTNPTNWLNYPPDTTNPIWVSQATKTPAGALVGTWSAPVRWNGLQGIAGANGSNGIPGAGFYGAKYSVIDWTTSVASSRFQSLAGRSPVNNDILTQTRTDGADSQARRFNGSSWVGVELQVNGDIVATGTIATTKLIITPSSLCPDPYFYDMQFWGGNRNEGWFSYQGSELPGAFGFSRCVVLTGDGSNTRKHLWSSQVGAPRMGEVVRLKAVVVNVSSQTIFVMAKFKSATGADLGDINILVGANDGNNAARVATGVVPPNTSKVEFILYNESGAPHTGQVFVSAVTMDVMSGADLIVNGSITADKIEAGSITGDRITAGTSISTPIINGGQINGVNGSFSGTVLADQIIGDVYNIKRITNIPASNYWWLQSFSGVTASKRKMITFNITASPLPRIATFENLVLGFGTIDQTAGSSATGTVYAQRSNGTVVASWPFSSQGILTFAGYRKDYGFGSVVVLDNVPIAVGETSIEFWISVNSVTITSGGFFNYSLRAGVSILNSVLNNFRFVQIQTVNAGTSSGVSIASA